MFGDIISGFMNYQGNKKAQGAANKAANRQQALEREMFEYGKELNQPFYDLGLPAFKSMSSAILGTVDPSTGRTWAPTESPAFKWQQEQAQKQTGRSLRALGRQNSTFGMNTMSDLNRNLVAGEYDKQLSRLSDLSNIARGGASTLTGLGSNYAGNQGRNIMNQGEMNANAILARYAIPGQSATNLEDKAIRIASMFAPTGGGLR